MGGGGLNSNALFSAGVTAFKNLLKSDSKNGTAALVLGSSAAFSIADFTVAVISLIWFSTLAVFSNVGSGIALAIASGLVSLIVFQSVSASFIRFCNSLVVASTGLRPDLFIASVS